MFRDLLGIKKVPISASNWPDLVVRSTRTVHLYTCISNVTVNTHTRKSLCEGIPKVQTKCRFSDPKNRKTKFNDMR